MSLKLTGTERSWVLYDVGNSAFTLMLSTIIPIYFNSIAGEELSSVDYLAYWGYAASIATVLCAVLGPFLGAVSDRRGMKIRMFSCVLAVGVIGCAALGFVNEWLVFLIVLVITRLGYSLSLVFYDSMLVDVSSPQSMHNVSALGYAWGYIGSCIPFVVCLVLSMVWHWNDYYEPSVYMSVTEKSAMVTQMLPNLYNWISNMPSDMMNSSKDLETMYHEGVVMAATAIAIAPLLIAYAFLQKRFMESVERSGLVG